MDVRSVAEKVREKREARGWSQRFLDQRAELSHGYINKLEAGQIPNFSMSQLRKIADALGVGLDELLWDEWAGPRKDVNSELEEIQVNLMTLGELDPESLASLGKIVLAMKERAERAYLEERRAKRRRQRSAELAGPADNQV